MNETLVHLIFNHVPVVGIPLMTLVIAWGSLRRSREILRLGLGLVIVISAFTYPVFLTGEAAHETTEDTSTAEMFVEQHEERAQVTLIVVLVTGVLAALAFWQTRGDRALGVVPTTIVLFALLASSGMLAWTAHEGGRIRHDEVRAQVSPLRSTPHAEEGKESEHDERQRRRSG